MIKLSQDKAFDTIKAMVDSKLKLFVQGGAVNASISKLPLKKTDKVYLVSIFEGGDHDGKHMRLDALDFEKVVNVLINDNHELTIETY